MDYIQLFFANFYQLLLKLTPRESNLHPYSHNNMIKGITYIETEDNIEVNIVAVNDRGRNYVGDVNEATLAQWLGRGRTLLEERNYHFIQRAINQSALLTADTVEWDGGGEFEIY